ncbi:O-antigen ligase family protein [Anaerosolibacter sp.]|uniref:O-antigen ligase family protein n=1 Tax=Anaerosolibacter sp. TaxID=1872527 RepID=UPI0039EFBF3C
MSGKTKKSFGVKENVSFIFYALLLLLWYPPFFRGLFFQKELVPTHIITAIVFFIYYMINRKEESLKKFTWTEAGLFLLILTYGISTSMAVSKNLSIQETLKYMNYFLICVMARGLVNNKKRVDMALITLVIGGGIVMMIGIGAALESIDYNGAFVGGMMNSTFQYHNTFGIYCLAMLFLSYVLGCDMKDKSRYAMSGLSFMFFFGFIFSYSRGAWVLLPVTGLLYYILAPVKYKRSFITYLLGNLIGLAVVMKGFSNVLQATDKSAGWLWVIAGLLVSVAVEVLLERVLDKINLKEKIYAVLVPILAVFIPIVAVLFREPVIKLLPATLAERLESISLGTETVTERTVFYTDAFKIIKNYPIFGTGGGGWNALYKMYQSYAYNSTQAHSYFMQVWVETGAVGILILSGTLLVYLYQAYKIYRNCEDKDIKARHVAIAAAVLSILLHSIIDFDLSLSAVSIILWGLIGIQYGLGMDQSVVRVIKREQTKYLAVSATCVLFVVSLVSYIAMDAAGQGLRLARSNKIEEAQGHFKTAVLFNPWSPTYLADYANITNAIGQSNKDASLIQESLEAMDEAVSIGKYEYVLVANSPAFYLKNGQRDKAIEAIAILEKHHPLNSDTYEVKTEALLVIADSYLKQNEGDQAKLLLNEVIEVENKINALNQKIKDTVEINNMVRFVEITPITGANIAKAKTMFNKL